MKSAKAWVAAAIASLGTIAVPTATHPWSWWDLLAAASVGLITWQGTYWVSNTGGSNAR